MTYLLKKHIEKIKLDNGQDVLFDPETGDTHVLDEIGSVILTLCDGSNSIDEIVSCLSTEFNAPNEEIRVDVESFLKDLVEKNVLDNKD
ncbi:MAG: pyrroloquinoline quinone biosynthesis peptide chaperone PqqD [Clostridiales bacterium]|nr:pyrroloquinoline quinone biosynthesis peptide chaperone PqqD [Clostridiales bacterium]